MTSPLDRLTPKQRETLELVAQYKSSKEIARELDVTSHTVDARLKRVQEVLGVSGRAEAARLYRSETEGLAAPMQPALGDLVYGSPDLSEDAHLGDREPSPGDRNPVGGEPMQLHEPRSAYLGDWVNEGEARPWYAVLFEAGRPNDLAPLARTMWIAALTFLAIFSMAAAVSLAEGLSRIF